MPLSNKKEATFKITLLDGLEAILLQFQLPQHVQDGEGLLGDGRELVAAQVEPFQLSTEGEIRKVRLFD